MRCGGYCSLVRSHIPGQGEDLYAGMGVEI